MRLPDVRYAIEATIFPGLLLLAGLRRCSCPGASGAGCRCGRGRGAVRVRARAVAEGRGATSCGSTAALRCRGCRTGCCSRFPGLGALRAPVRVEYVLVALLVAATAIALHRAARRRARARVDRRRGRRAVLLATNLLVPVPTTTFGTTPGERARAARRSRGSPVPGDTVLSVPADCDPAFASLQVFHHTPVVGCAGSFAANPWSKLAPYVAVGRVHEAAVRSHGVRPAIDDRPTASVPAPFDADDVAALRRDFGVRFVVDRPLQARTGVRAGDRAALPVLQRAPSLGARRALRGDRPRPASRRRRLTVTAQEEREAVAEVVLQAEVVVQHLGRARDRRASSRRSARPS